MCCGVCGEFRIVPLLPCSRYGLAARMILHSVKHIRTSYMRAPNPTQPQPARPLRSANRARFQTAMTRVLMCRWRMHSHRTPARDTCDPSKHTHEGGCHACATVLILGCLRDSNGDAPWPPERRQLGCQRAPGRGAEGAMAARQDRPFCDALTTAAGSACETLAQEDPRPHPDAGLPPA